MLVGCRGAVGRGRGCLGGDVWEVGLVVLVKGVHLQEGENKTKKREKVGIAFKGKNNGKNERNKERTKERTKEGRKEKREKEIKKERRTGRKTAKERQR